MQCEPTNVHIRMLHLRVGLETEDTHLMSTI